MASVSSAFAGATPPTSTNVPPVIQRNYDDARKKYEAAPGEFDAAWQFGKACFDRAEFSHGSAERAKLADEGIAASKVAEQARPSQAEGHYYVALNMAQLARTKLWNALPLLPGMEQGWLAAQQLDQKLDYAGPDRYVGLLYRDAPGWPISLGDRTKARQHLLRAEEISPEFPENDLNLIESYLGWNEYSNAIKAWNKLRDKLPDALRQFTGEYWDESWKDWNERREKIRAALALHAAHAGH